MMTFEIIISVKLSDKHKSNHTPVSSSPTNELHSSFLDFSSCCRVNPFHSKAHLFFMDLASNMSWIIEMWYKHCILLLTVIYVYTFWSYHRVSFIDIHCVWTVQAKLALSITGLISLWLGHLRITFPWCWNRHYFIIK